MHDVCLAFLWHQHQPYYPDDLSGENPMPWVRLHGVKDYWGMAKLLEESPAVHATINLVPSLLQQLLAYTDEGREDTHWRISRSSPDDLSRDDLDYLLTNFFMVHPDRMIRPYARYYELFRKRGIDIDTAEQARKRFNRRDLLDLQVWSNLVWFHPLAFEQDKELAELRRKGRDFGQDEKLWLLDRQLELLAEVVPLHRRLQDRGQVELTTTPFFHPILPLLWDKRLARRAMPDVVLPKHLEGHAEDVERQIAMAVDYHEKLFGRPARGMWPSEGSVCEGILPAIVAAGIEWLATDEEILTRSTDNWVSRDGQGFLRNPEMLYRPWRVEQQGRSLQIIFRDHAMSDQIGFHYQGHDTEHAVNDFISKVEAVGRATRGNAGHRPTLLSIILDGENCWEYYGNAGVDFLRSLYRRVAEHPRIQSVRVSDYLEKHPAADKLNHLFPGSWIGHNFGIWIGHPECNRAWDLLEETRNHLVRREEEKTKPAEILARAWNELYIAEGSDWFWWFGDTHSSSQDALFDRLYRAHLANVYRLLGDPPPAELARPISQGHHARLHTQPTALLNIKVDGRRTYFEWINAGHHARQGGRGTMSQAEKGLVSDVYFGFDLKHLAVRLDARDGSVGERLGRVDKIKLVFLEPEGFEVHLARLDRRRPKAELWNKGNPVAHAGIEAAADRILEWTVPLAKLGVHTDDAVHFFVQLVQDGTLIERVPLEGTIETSVPSADFEMIMWQA
ncbi:MAG: alpha-amylase/alpha-mannosidase [Pirellulaceae bacterium]|nr:alpha-amylase/alpha-mannosidase [Pirellulaceae bacterium]